MRATKSSGSSQAACAAAMAKVAASSGDFEAPNARFFSYTGETVHALYWTECVLGGAMSCGLAAVAPIGSTGKMQVTVVPSRGAVSIRTRP